MGRWTPAPTTPGTPGCSGPGYLQSHPDERLETLTTREREIAGLVAKGLDNHQIADQLFISAGTVKTHVSNISAKLRARNRVGIAVWAWETGLVSRW